MNISAGKIHFNLRKNDEKQSKEEELGISIVEFNFRN